MKHTSGPWQVISYSVFQADEVGNKQVVHNIKGDSKEERLANASLIAAAPELLEACKDLAHQVAILNQKFLNKNDKYSALQKGVVQSYNKAIKAIAKAEGGKK